MSTIAIKGHSTRGSEVIALLEMLGGKNTKCCCGGFSHRIYFIDKNNNIIDSDRMHHLDYVQLTIEEFEEKFPYKVGDKVSSKYLKNYKIEKMEWEDINNRVIYKLQGMGWYAANELQPYKEEKSILPYMDYDVVDKEQEPMEITGIEVHNGICRVIKTNKDKHEIVADKDYEIIQENGKYYAVKKKPKYPKTYEECCDVLGRTLPINDDVEGYKWELIMNFQRILVCRDAYWKIAGEEMGLGEPWKPDWNEQTPKYTIVVLANELVKRYALTQNFILVFPTEEMRDVFYENFKDLIESCKELL